MTKLHFLTAFILFCTTCYAQQVVVGLDKMNVAYVGVVNPISVASDIYSCDELVVKVDNEVLHGKDCQYSFSPSKAGRVTIAIYGKHSGELKKIGGVPVRVCKIPEPVVSLADKTDGYISQAELSVCDGPAISFRNFDFDLSVRITSFSISIYRPPFDEPEYHKVLSGAQFDEETLKKFTQLKHNDVIEISDIRAQGPDSSQQLKKISLKISN